MIFVRAFVIGVAIIAAMGLFALGAWLEQGGKSDPEDYDDE